MQNTADTTSLSEDEYEYEYDETETETFYVNIDLTSYNGALRQPRRGVGSSAADELEAEAEKAPSPADREEAEEEQEQEQEEEEEDDDDDDETGNATAEAADIESAGRLQIMELHGKNPFVSYRNHIFSCEWVDMIGTDMHFVRREDSSEPDPTYAKHGDQYSLIGTSGIKIMGRKARLTAPAGAGAGAGAVSREQTDRPEGQPQLDNAGSAQVRFLQELMDIKRERGEMDTVQMAFGTRRGSTNFEDRIGRWANTEERLSMIHQLNRAALGGDQNAVAKLEELYTQIEADADADMDVDANVAADSVPSG